MPVRKSAISWLFLMISAACFAIPPGITITVPSANSTIADGTTFSVLGNIRAARTRQPDQQWFVIYPNVLLELYLPVEPLLLISSTTTPTAFQDDQTRTGTFNGTLTARQQRGVIYPYQVAATALDRINQRTGEIAEISISIPPAAP
jgi:hypothetical protein